LFWSHQIKSLVIFQIPQNNTKLSLLFWSHQIKSLVIFQIPQNNTKG